jgi:hypothetical protein
MTQGYQPNAGPRDPQPPPRNPSGETMPDEARKAVRLAIATHLTHALMSQRVWDMVDETKDRLGNGL